MKVLVIDDKIEELNRAHKACRAMGWEMPIRCDTNLEAGFKERRKWAEMIDHVDGVVTDLMWAENERDGEKPMGLLVVVHALFRGKPVVVCTNLGEYPKSNHNEAINFIFAGYLNDFFVPGEKAFDVVENKDWKKSMELLAKQAERAKKKTRQG